MQISQVPLKILFALISSQSGPIYLKFAGTEAHIYMDKQLNFQVYIFFYRFPHRRFTETNHSHTRPWPTTICVQVNLNYFPSRVFLKIRIKQKGKITLTPAKSPRKRIWHHYVWKHMKPLWSSYWEKLNIELAVSVIWGCCWFMLGQYLSKIICFLRNIKVA